MIRPEKEIGRKTGHYVLGRIYHFYLDGFRSMTWGRTLWIIILLKLFFMFAILKLFFFPDFLKGKDQEEKQDFIGKELIERFSDPIFPARVCHPFSNLCLWMPEDGFRDT